MVLPLRILTLVLILHLTAPLDAQLNLRQTSGHNDLKAWLGIQYRHSFSKAWKLQLNFQTRLEQAFSLLDKNLVELEATYQHPKGKFLKLLKFGAGFRGLGVNDIRGRERGHRWGYRVYGFVSLNKKWKRWQFGYRLFYQDQNILPSGVEIGNQAQTLRNRLAIEYNIKNWKLDPEFRVEIFYPFQQLEVTGFNLLRLGLGTQYKINKHHALKFKLMYQRTLGLAYTQHTGILAVIYQYRTKRKKKKGK